MDALADVPVDRQIAIGFRIDLEQSGPEGTGTAQNEVRDLLLHFSFGDAAEAAESATNLAERLCDATDQLRRQQPTRQSMRQGAQHSDVIDGGVGAHQLAATDASPRSVRSHTNAKSFVKKVGRRKVVATRAISKVGTERDIGVVPGSPTVAASLRVTTHSNEATGRAAGDGYGRYCQAAISGIRSSPVCADVLPLCDVRPGFDAHHITDHVRIRVEVVGLRLRGRVPLHVAPLPFVSPAEVQAVRMVRMGHLIHPRAMRGARNPPRRPSHYLDRPTARAIGDASSEQRHAAVGGFPLDHGRFNQADLDRCPQVGGDGVEDGRLVCQPVRPGNDDVERTTPF